MKFMFLGTAAAEGIPGLFCECDTCVRSRKIGGKCLRSRSQALINDDLLIDFNADSAVHFLKYGIESSKIKYCIITHNHSDHLYPPDFEMRRPGFCHIKNPFPIIVYGSEAVEKSMEDVIDCLEKSDSLEFKRVALYETFVAGDYEITPLKAIHPEDSGPVIYLISSKGKTILYGHDTHYFDESVWEYFKEHPIHIDLASLDCTEANKPQMPYIGHMNLNDNIKVKEKLISLGCADDKTVFVCNHFSHNGETAVYDDFAPIAQKHGFLTSYDGMTIEL